MFPRGFQIGSTQIHPATVLAPMVGVTDTVFRRLIRSQGGCGLIMTEFTSSHGVVATSKSTQAHARVSLPVLRSRRASHIRAALRLRSASHGRCRAVLPGHGLRSCRYQLRLPGEESGPVQRGLGLLRDLPLVERLLRSVQLGHLHPADHEVPRWLERSGTGQRADGQAGRRLRPGGHRAAPAHARAGL